MIYKLIDPLCNFYLEFINDSKIIGKKHWVNIESSARVRVWKGYAFENVCWNHIDELKEALRIGGVITNETLWTKRSADDSEGTQIDLIIVSNDNVVNMCEMKFYSDEFEVDKDYHLTLERRKKLLQEKIPKKAVIHNTLVTTFGIRKKGYYGDFVAVITMDELFGK